MNKKQNNNKPKNKFVLLDGPDCAGKTSVIEILQDMINIQVVKEPLPKYREEILNSSTSEPRRQELFLKSRNELNAGISQRLEQSHVISDSGALRGLAYAPEGWYHNVLMNYYSQRTKHDLIIYMDISYDTFVERMNNRVANGEPMDILESLDEEKYNDRRANFFIAIARLISDGYNVMVVNVDQTIHDVPSIIYDYLTSDDS